ncbi:MAG: dihydrolipoamide acetyltransferase [Myxococcota bacterium]|nr:dihydrolipoamide acetyltransferase [Myxococcota bacterium]
MPFRLTHFVPVCLLVLLLAPTALAENAGLVPELLDFQDETETEEETGSIPTDSADESGNTTEAEPAAPASPEAVEISIYRELKTVESQVDELKEKVFRSKARLLLLEEKVIRGVVSGAKAVIRHVNNLGPSYSLESVTYYFDGNPIYQKTNAGTKGELAREKKVEIFEANVPPGDHTLSVTGVIRGKRTGLFEYLSDYSFEFSSSYSFVAQDGQTTRLDSQLFKKGGPLADYVDGPTIEFKLLDNRAGKDKDKDKGKDKEQDDEAPADQGSGS